MAIDPVATSINDLIAAVEAIEMELGLLPSGPYASTRTRLDILEARINNPFAPAPNVNNPFYIGGSPVSGVSIQDGFGDPRVTLPPAIPGSLYLREDGAVGEGLYEYRPDGYWHLISWSARGDLSGDNISQTVIGIQGNPVKANALGIANDGYVLTWINSDGYWEAKPTTFETVDIFGDVIGTTAASTVVKIQGTPVSSTMPTNQQTLVNNGTSYVLSGVQVIFNVMSYGALGNGIHDDTAAINATIAAATAVSNAIVYFPAGTYLISSTINVANTLSMKGNGIHTTTILQNTSGLEVINVTDATDFSLQDIKIQSAGAAHAVHVKAVANGNMEHPTLQNVWIVGFGSPGQSSSSVASSIFTVPSHGFSNGNIVQFNSLIAGTYFVSPIFSASGNTVTINSHGLVNNDPVQFNDNDFGTLPTGVSTRTTYYVINKTLNTFQFSTSISGSPVTFTGTGSTYPQVYTWGVVPGGLQPYLRYFIVNKTTNTFQVSATSGGSPITITASPTSTCKVGKVYAGIVFDSAGNNIYSPRVRDCLVDGGGGTLADGGARVGLLLLESSGTFDIVHCSVMGGEFANLKTAVDVQAASECFVSLSHVYNVVDGCGGGTAFYCNSSTGLYTSDIRFEGSAIERAMVLDTNSYGNNVTGAFTFAPWQIIDLGASNSYRLGLDSNQINLQSGAFTFTNLYQNNIYELTPGHGVTIEGLTSKSTEVDINQPLVLGLGAIIKSYNPAQNITIERPDNVGAQLIVGSGFVNTFALFTVYNSAGSVSTITLDGNGSTITFDKNAATPPVINQANLTTSSGTGQTLTIQAQNETGTTSVGGALNLTSGTGTTSNGLVNLQSGGTTIVSVSGTKFINTKGLRRNVTPTTISYAVLTTDEVIAVGSTAAGVTMTLPSSPTTGDTYLIKDQAGLAATHNIAIAGNGNNIDGSATYTLVVNYAALVVTYTGSQWSVC